MRVDRWFSSWYLGNDGRRSDRNEHGKKTEHDTSSRRAASQVLTVEVKIIELLTHEVQIPGPYTQPTELAFLVNIQKEF